MLQNLSPAVVVIGALREIWIHMFTIKPEEGNQWSSGLLITNKIAICNKFYIPASYLGYLSLNVPIMSTAIEQT